MKILKELKLIASLTVIVFVLVTIPVTIFVSLNTEKTPIKAKASTPTAGYNEQTVVTGLATPVAMAFAPDGRIFVTEKCNGVRIIKSGVKLANYFVQPTNNCQGERGVLGIAVDPAFTTNNYIYVYYTSTSGSIHNRVSRFTANGDTAVAGSEKVLIDLESLCSATNHNGGSLGFGKDGKLYISQGDNYCDHTNSQKLGSWLGKVLRINSDGTIPTDNPFYNTAGAKREIWALGFRNPFTFAVDQVSGKIYVNDVGENTIEEVDDLQKGGNYGSPDCEGTVNWLGTCSGHGYIAPIYSYNHNVGKAVTGGSFYTGTQFPGKSGHYFFADYVSSWIKDYDPATGTVANASFTTNASGPVNIQTGIDGKLYYLAINSGSIFSISYGTTPPKPSAQSLWCETETAILTAPMVKGSETAASGGAYIFTTANDTTSAPSPATTGSALLNVNIPAAGTYTVWSRVKYASSSSNSYFLQINNSSNFFKVGNDENFGTWHWINIANADTTPSNITYNFTLPGSYQFKLIGREANTLIDKIFLTDDLNYKPDDSNLPGSSACSVNKPPLPIISAPLTTLKYSYNQTVSFAGSATDPEDGAVPAAKLSWDVKLVHNNDHNHPAYNFPGVASGTFKTDNLGGGEPSSNTFYLLTLTATDSKGVSASSSVNIYPNTAIMTFNTVPSGLTVGITNVIQQASPVSYTSVVGFPLTIFTLSPQNNGTKKYDFKSWSDLGAISHLISVPTTKTTYTATFQEQVDNTPPTVILTAPPAGTVSGLVNITASPSDNIGISRVEFFNNKSTALICSITSTPYTCSWDSRTVANGQVSLFAVAHDTSDNLASSPSVYVTVQNGDSQKPTAPTLAGPVSGTLVNLSWSGASDNVGVTGYYIVRNGITIKQVTTTNYSDSPTCGPNLAYYVMAFDAAGNTSVPSNTVNPTLTCPDTSPPTTPGSLTATPGVNQQINLSWIASSDNIGVAGYEVWRSSLGGTFAKIATTPVATSFGDTGLTSGTSYSYFVKAFDGAKNYSDASNSATAKTQDSFGFTGHWFNSTNFTSEVLPTTIDSAINFVWPGSPRTGVNSDKFSTRWSGTFDFDNGPYRFNASVDDGVRIYIDNETVPVVGSWIDQPTTTYNALRSMTAGKHTVRVDYYDNCCDAVVKVNWVHAKTCYDMTGDGLVNRDDLNLVADHFLQKGTSLPWDLDGDGAVSILDITRVSNQYNTTCR